jgi:hypothetical protein
MLPFPVNIIQKTVFNGRGADGNSGSQDSGVNTYWWMDFYCLPIQGHIFGWLFLFQKSAVYLSHAF